MKTKFLTAAAIALFLASVMFAPWATKLGTYAYAPLFCAPRYGYYLQWGNLLVEWLAIGILYAWLLWLCPQPTKVSPDLKRIFDESNRPGF